MSDGVPESHQDAAEEVRAHLVAVRGGAPFLSPADARRLVGWLDDGLDVPSILCAIERAAEARRKRRSRVPLSLSHASRHLGKTTKGGLAPTATTDHPLKPLARALAQRAPADPRRDDLRALAQRLTHLPAEPHEALLRQAMGAIREFFMAAWDGLSRGEREGLLEDALEGLGDLKGVDEQSRQAAAEEIARDTLRESYPLLTAATLWDLVHR